MTVGLLLVASRARAQGSVLSAAEVLEAKLMRQIGPHTRAWIAQEAAREAQMQELTEAAALSAVRAEAPMLMDRRSRALETLSNLMKKLSETSASITQNLP